MRRLGCRLALATGLSILASSFLAGPLAAAWPERPVKLVYPYPPGSPSDTLIRHLGTYLSKRYGQPFVVENRAGASATIGTEAVAKAPPDGYSVLATPNAPIVLLPQLRKTGYAPSDLAPVAPLAEFVYAMGVLPSLGVKTVKELVELAKKNPGKFSYASPGSGSATNLRGEAFKLLAGIDVLHVPYRSMVEPLQDLLEGRITFMSDNNIIPFAKQGKIVLLAVTSENRSPELPDVPTLTEAGYYMDLPTWLGIYVPVATPQPIQDSLARAMDEIMADEEMRSAAIKLGYFPMRSTRPEMVERLKRETASFADWVKKTGMKIE